MKTPMCNIFGIFSRIVGRTFARTTVMLLTWFSVSCGGEPSGNEITSEGVEGETRRSTTSLNGRKQCFNIVGGVETSEFPAAVLLVKYDGDFIVSRCSGTFVGDNVVVTAAHCVADTPTGSNAVLIEDCAERSFHFVDSTAVYHHGITDEFFEDAQAIGSLSYDAMSRDLAVLMFPDDTAPATVDLTDLTPTYGLEATMVGYGIAYTPDDPRSANTVVFEDIKKRVGTNELVDPEDTVADPDRVLAVLRERHKVDTVEPGEYVTTAVGDSGGPLFLDNKLAGVTSAGAVLVNALEQKADFAIFVNLLSDLSVELLSAAESDGARFDGWQAYLDTAE